jgi:hypothetical protein
MLHLRKGSRLVAHARDVARLHPAAHVSRAITSRASDATPTPAGSASRRLVAPLSQNAPSHGTVPDDEVKLADHSWRQLNHIWNAEELQARCVCRLTPPRWS